MSKNDVGFEAVTHLWRDGDLSPNVFRDGDAMPRAHAEGLGVADVYMMHKLGCLHWLQGLNAEATDEMVGEALGKFGVVEKVKAREADWLRWCAFTWLRQNWSMWLHNP